MFSLVPITGKRQCQRWRGTTPLHQQQGGLVGVRQHQLNDRAKSGGVRPPLTPAKPLFRWYKATPAKRQCPPLAGGGGWEATVKIVRQGRRRRRRPFQARI